MKKTIACLMLCTLCMLFTVSTSNYAYAHEEIPTYYSPGGGEAGGDGIWDKVCKTAGELCKLASGGWGRCLVIALEIYACIADDPENPTLTEMPICECSTDRPCEQTCRCGFRSAGTGPVVFGSHSCGSQAQ